MVNRAAIVVATARPPVMASPIAVPRMAARVARGSEQVVSLQQLAGNKIDLSGLLLAAVIFGGLGVLIDVAIAQAVTIDELLELDPTLSKRQLYTRTMRIGVAHLGATINTLIFAYLGTALPVLVLLALQIESFSATINLPRPSGSPMKASPFTPASLIFWAYGVQSLTPAGG